MKPAVRLTVAAVLAVALALSTSSIALAHHIGQQDPRGEVNEERVHGLSRPVDAGQPEDAGEAVSKPDDAGRPEAPGYPGDTEPGYPGGFGI